MNAKCYTVIRVEWTAERGYHTPSAYAVGYYRYPHQAQEAAATDAESARVAKVSRYHVMVSLIDGVAGRNVEICGSLQYVIPAVAAAVAYTAGTVHAEIERDWQDADCDIAILCGEVEYAS